MIKTNTLFILGAGASNPFEYPTSVKLRDEILTEGHEHDVVNALNKNDEGGFFRDTFYEKIKEFQYHFARSSRYSIDSFLEHRPEFMDIGKTYIAKVLIAYEDDIKLRLFYEKNWYMYLFNRFDDIYEGLYLNNISFITFNYDRSLEQFLFEAIISLFDIQSSECVEVMKEFPIVHLYGQLDPLPWQESGGKKYSSTENLLERLRAAPVNIKLISNERDIEESEDFQEESEDFQKAYKLIEWADRIFFLGFSFDITNLKRLNISLMTHKTIIGTAYGLEPARYNWIKNYFNNKAHTEIHLHNDKDALSLLQHYLEIE